MTDKFEAKHRTVWRKSQPHQAPRRSMEMGFPVLLVNEDLDQPEKVAQALADLLNKHWVDNKD